MTHVPPNDCKKMPEVLLIIPTRHRTPDLRNCLAILSSQLPGDGSVGIHVCDDGDDETTGRMVKGEFPHVSCQKGPRRGPGANRNAGVRATSSGWLIFVDDDCHPRPGFIGAYLAAIRSLGSDTDVVLVGPTVRCGEGRDSLLFEAPHNPLGEGGLPPSCNFSMTRGLFLKSGGFDERFRYSFEDIEFFARLTQTGVPIRFVPDAGVDHPSRPISSARVRALRWEARVITSLDYGASVFQTSYLLPRHILLVTLARFRGRRLSRENLFAAWQFFREVVLALAMLPGWLVHYGRGPLSPFWVEQVRLGKAPRKFGL